MGFQFWDCGYCGLRENWVPQTWFFIIIFPWKQQFWCIRSQTPTYRRSATWWCRQPPRGASAVKLHPAVRTAEWPGKAMESWGYQGLLVGFCWYVWSTSVGCYQQPDWKLNSDKKWPEHTFILRRRVALCQRAICWLPFMHFWQSFLAQTQGRPFFCNAPDVLFVTQLEPPSARP